MTRHVPSEFANKIREVQAEVERARLESRREFEVSREVLPGVRLVKTQRLGLPIVFSLWSWDTDIAELCGDAAYPAAEGALAVDREQLAELSARGLALDPSFLTRSESVPGMSYLLVDHLSPEQLKRALARLLPDHAA
ncbi:MAG: hypothetical protein GX537_02000 [Actinobacteria bacterium]|jgi:hypothetical protein|nr:hypothetical protein [Actinomycetota bacterium]